MKHHGLRHAPFVSKIGRGEINLCRYIPFFGVSVPSYGLLLCVAVFTVGFLVLRQAKEVEISFEDMIIFQAVSIGAALCGGVILYLFITYSPQQLLTYVRRGDFSFLRSSGLVFYGGLIGGIFGALLSAKYLRITIERLEKIVVPYLPLGHAIGRMGCLMAGCCYGFEYHGIFAVQNPFAAYESCFPVQALEAVLNLVVMLILHFAAKKPAYRYRLLCLYLKLYAAVRFFTEFFRADIIRGSYFCFSTSQWISILLFLCSLLYGILQKRKEL